MPLKIIAEKLRGFVADQQAVITEVSDDRLELTIDGEAIPQKRRSSDRAVSFIVELNFDEKEIAVEGARGATVKTMVEVIVCTKYGRDRRQKDAMERARQMVSSLKSYLVAQDYLPPE